MLLLEKMFAIVIIYLLHFLVQTTENYEIAFALKEYLTDYEKVNIKLSIADFENVNNSLLFEAFNTSFDVQLYPGEHINLSEVLIEIHTANKVKKEYLSGRSLKLYEGSIKGNSESKVLGYFDKGLFTAIIETSKTMYFLEPLNRFSGNNDTQNYTAVIYRGQDIIYPSCIKNKNCSRFPRDVVEEPIEFYSRNGKSLNNESYVDRLEFETTQNSNRKFNSSLSNEDSNLIRKKREIVGDIYETFEDLNLIEAGNLIQTSTDDLNEWKQTGEYSDADHNNNNFTTVINFLSFPIENHALDKPLSSTEWLLEHGANPNFAQSSNLNKDQEKFQKEPKIKKKDENTTRWTKENTICNVEAYVDHTYFMRMAGDVRKIVSEISLLIKQSDKIMRSLDLDDDGKPEELRIAVDKFVIFDSVEAVDYVLNFESEDAIELMDSFVRRKQDHCLSIGFMDRNLSHGILGLAFKGSSKSLYEGGICAPTKVSEKGDFVTLNTILISVRVFGMSLPVGTNVMTTVHEIGHSFGAEHDDPKNILCSPGGEEGNFIMHERSLDGSKPNNYKFSPCSKRQIKEVLQFRGGCLKPVGDLKTEDLCGNGKIDENEECDCGTIAECQIRPNCCTPPGGVGKDKGCTFQTELGYLCDPERDLCCTFNCKYVPAKWRFHCGASNHECAPAFCSGNSSSCPQPKESPDGTACQMNSKTCYKGQCNSTICKDHGLKDCICSHKSDYECEVCCLEDKRCKPASKLKFSTPSGEAFVRYKGTPCDSNKGLCNSNGECKLQNETSSVHNLQALSFGFILYILLIQIAVGEN